MLLVSSYVNEFYQKKNISYVISLNINNIFKQKSYEVVA